MEAKDVIRIAESVSLNFANRSDESTLIEFAELIAAAERAARLEAVEKIERDTYKVPTEYKVHPDDWAELRIQLKPHVTYPNNDPLRWPEIFGLRIVLDYSAERLPRKPNEE